MVFRKAAILGIECVDVYTGIFLGCGDLILRIIRLTGGDLFLDAHPPIAYNLNAFWPLCVCSTNFCAVGFLAV